MNHLNEDKLLEYFLEISAGNNEADEIEGHIQSCPECRKMLERLRNDIMLIGSIKPARQRRGNSKKRKYHRLFYRTSRVAALLIIGIGIGWAGSTVINKQPEAVSPAYIRLSPPPDSVYGYVDADATSIPVEIRSQTSILIKDSQ